MKGEKTVFLHIGGSKIVFLREIIGVFSLKLRENPTNKQFLESNKETRFLHGEEFSRHKSFVITEDKVQLSPISPTTLARRQKG